MIWTVTAIPDRIIIKLEIMELNGKSPDFPGLVLPTFDIAPGIQPGAWVFAPKTSGMSTENFESVRANPLLRLPSPVIRVEARGYCANRAGKYPLFPA
jgi:hypothetical protein